MAFKRDVLRKLYDIIAPIRDAGGPLTAGTQELLQLAKAADAPRSAGRIAPPARESSPLAPPVTPPIAAYQ